MNLSKFVSLRQSGKALTSAGAVTLGGAITKVIMRIAGHQWPWFVDEGMSDAVDVIVCGALAYLGAYAGPAQQQGG